MKKLLFLSTLALALCSTTFAQSGPSKSYGTAFSQQSAMSTGRLPVLMANKQKIENFRAIGYVAEVCQKEGCWMTIKSNKNSNDRVLVKMKDHSFVLPKDVAGQTAVVNGTIVKKTQTVAEQKHLLEDAGASQAEISKITSPKEIYEMQATGVVLYNN
jgi:hypothetical protein